MAPADGTAGRGVALVLVSHARAVADGVARIAGQMAPDVTIVPAGGTDDDGLGTSVDLVAGAVERALAAGTGAVVLTDLGSAVLTAETVLELLDDDDVAARVVIADAPFVEGAVSAAVAAQQGGDAAAVAEAAREAGRRFGDASGEGGAGTDGAPAPTAGGADPDAVVERVALRNPLGLHARPAAVVARTVADLGVAVTIDGADAASVLELMSLGVTGGHELTVAAVGPRAREAVDAVVALVVSGFGEV